MRGVTFSQASWREALNQATQQLAQANVDSPRLVAEILLAHILNIPRIETFKVSETLKVLPTYQSLVDRCAAGEPLAYVIGHKEFYDLDFICDPRGLIPRPETELLVEAILNVARSTFHLHLADVGTGSGCIAVTLAKHMPTARVYAIDLSPDALELARLNAQRNGVSDRITFLCGDLLEPLPAPVHIIAANLPYVTTGEWETLPPNIRLHEPRLALDGGADGLDLIRRLLAQSAEQLEPGGVIALEIGAAQGQAALHLARAAFPTAQIELKQDYAGLDRLIIIETPLGSEEHHDLSFNCTRPGWHGDGR